MPAPTVFPCMANAELPLVESHAYLTDILTAYDGSEQRVRLRVIPNGGMSFGIRATGADARVVSPLLQANAGGLWAVPLWQYAVVLGSDVTPSDSSLTAATGSVPFQDALWVGPWVLVWKDARHFELMGLSYADSGTVYLLDPAVGSWTAGQCYVIPVRTARLASSVSVEWETRNVCSANLEFAFDIVEGPEGYAYPVEMPAFTTYLGVELLEVIPDRSEAIPDRISRRVSLVSSPMGAQTAIVTDSAAAVGRPVLWKCFSRAEGFALSQFLDRRCGRALPFWMPSTESDLQLAGPKLAASSTIDVEWVGYAAQLFPGSGARRHLQLRSPAGATILRKVTNAVDNLDGTETLTLSAALGADITADWTVSFLRYCRLDDDAVRLAWSGIEYCEASVPVAELPKEAPL